MLFLSKLSFSQDSCLPKYNLPVKTITVAQNTKVAYVEKGGGDPIIFIHGLGGNLSHWLKCVTALSNSYQCIAIDLPGYGRSDKNISTAKDRMQYYADVVTEFIQKKGLQKVVLTGHSMSGQIAIIIALQHPELISKLILVAPAGLETFTEEEAAKMIAATPPELYQKQEEAVIRASYKMNFYQMPTDAETLIQDRLHLKKCADFNLYTEAVSKSIQGMLEHPVKAELSKITQPVLILFGSEDALIPNRFLHPKLSSDSLINEATALIKNSKSVVISQGGHLVPFEKPEEVAKEIKHFLE
jgi:pimeloyl-ACP methyl ester carboxylesterase